MFSEFEAALVRRVELLEDLIGEIVDADTDGAASIPQTLRDKLVAAYNESERVPKAAVDA